MRARPLRLVGRLLAVVGFAALLLVPAAAVAGAQTYPTPPGPSDPCTPNGLPVIGVVNGVDVCGARVSAAQVSQPSSSSGVLAFTGGNIALLTGLALVIVAGGLVLVRLSRRPAAAIR